MKIVLAHGCFDLVHFGHVLFLKEARKLGDRLVVTITADNFFTKGKPAFTEMQRLRWLREFRCVDDAYVVNEKTGVEAIRAVKPAIYAKGKDTGEVIPEEAAAVAEVGGKIAYVDAGLFFHSSELLSGRYARA